MSREAMQQALEALESDPISHAGLVSRKQAITALRQALETEQEPVAWLKTWPDGSVGEEHMSGNHNMKLIASLAQVNDFVMVHGNELQAILDYVQDMEQRISIVREQLQYLVAESVEPDAEPED